MSDLNLPEHPLFKVTLPGIPLLYYLICIGGYFGDWRTAICQSPPTISFWALVILYYLSIQLSALAGRQYVSVTFVLILVAIMWFAVALVSYKLNGYLKEVEIDLILHSPDFYFSYIPSFLAAFLAGRCFFRYEPSLNQYRKSRK